MNGSSPIATYNFEKTPRQERIAHALVDRLGKEGWVWFRDYYIEWNHVTINVQVFKEELIPIIREFIVDENMGGNDE